MQRSQSNNDIVIQIENESNYFDVLPAELIAYVFSYLDEEAMAQVSQACKRFFFTIINHSNLVLYERLSKEPLTLPISKRLLTQALLYWDSPDKTLQVPDMPKLLQDKQRSPLKINSFFRRRNHLLQQGELALQQSDQDKKRRAQTATKLFLLSLLPMLPGLLSENPLYLHLGIVVGLTLFVYGFWKELERQSALQAQEGTCVSAIPPLFKAAMQPNATVYEEGTLNLIKKYS